MLLSLMIRRTLFPAILFVRIIFPFSSYAASSKDLCDLAEKTGDSCVVPPGNQDSEEWQTAFIAAVLKALNDAQVNVGIQVKF